MAKDQPVIMVEVKGKHLSPLSSLDAELLDGYLDGDLFRLEYASRRSNPQNSLYWEMLGRVVEATGWWPNDKALHKELLIECGYHTKSYSLDRKSIRLIEDSTAFSAMKPKEFRVYFDQAVEALALHTGFDPLAFYREMEDGKRLRNAN